VRALCQLPRNLVFPPRKHNVKWPTRQRYTQYQAKLPRPTTAHSWGTFVAIWKCLYFVWRSFLLSWGKTDAPRGYRRRLCRYEDWFGGELHDVERPYKGSPWRVLGTPGQTGVGGWSNRKGRRSCGLWKDAVVKVGHYKGFMDALIKEFAYLWTGNRKCG